MIDPAILEAMHQVSWQPPAHIRAFEIQGSGEIQGTASAAKRMAPLVDQAEAALAAWIANAERAVGTLAEAHRSGGLPPGSSEWLDRTIALVEAATETDRAAYERRRKGARKAIRFVRSAAPAEAPEVERLFGRLLDATARLGRVRFELGLALKAMRASRAATGDAPAFDDPDELDAYLRAAVA